MQEQIEKQCFDMDREDSNFLCWDVELKVKGECVDRASKLS